MRFRSKSILERLENLNNLIRKGVLQMGIPKDPVMRLSYVNTQLRDNYSSLDDFCKSLDVDKEELIKSLEAINYFYNGESNQFV